MLVFKPDGIGDFILATGGIRLLADAIGESQVTLVVRDVVEPLARMQFPQADVVALPWKETRTFVNLFVVNACRIWRPLLRLRGRRFDAALSLRHMRDYLQNAFFYGVPAKRHIAVENLLARDGRWSRRFVESVWELVRRPSWVGYPPARTDLPLEMEAHRRVLKRFFSRDISSNEILPILRSSVEPQDYVVCAPVSAQESKDYPFDHWSTAISEAGIDPDKDMRICGTSFQAEKLEQFAQRLRSAGFHRVSVVFPADVASLVDLVAGARIVWAVDTAAAHMAIALGRPCLVVFSGLHKGMFAPWQKNARQVWVAPEPKNDGEKKRWHERLAPATVSAVMRDLER